MTDIKTGTPATGTHGILRNANSGVEIPVTYQGESYGYHNVVVDGSEGHMNSLPISAGWTFTPDKPTLPTEPGFYRPESDSRWAGAYFLSVEDGWHRINGYTGNSHREEPSKDDLPLVFLG